MTIERERQQRSRRGLLLAGLSVITPAGLLLVNAAAYVMVHLDAFRVAITASAVVSTLVLNGLTAWLGYRTATGLFPDFWPFQERNARIVVPLGALVLIGVAALGGWLTYRGLIDAKKLPNLQTFFAGLIGLAIPVGLALYVGRNPRARRRTRESAMRAFRTRGR